MAESGATLDGKPPTITFNHWKYAHYFELKENKGKNILVRCKLCPGQKCYSTAVNSTANLSKHLNKQHASQKLIAKCHDSRDNGPVQKKISFDQHQRRVTKQKLDRLIAAFIVEEMLPISMVESASLRRLVSYIPVAADKSPVSDRKTFLRYLEECYEKMESELKRTFESLRYVSTTADIWSSHNHSFLGVTVHWINPANFQREKAAVACKRIKGRHTYDVVGFELEQVHSHFGLSHRITATVTDNGSNFVKAFKVYASPEVSEDDEDVFFADMEQLLGNVEEGQFSLPPHFRCASHTLNLISCDIDKHLSACTESRAVYRSATAKCSALWTKASRSTVASEIVDEVVGRKLIVPTTTRWNSYHDALSRIGEMPVQDLNTLCTRLDSTALSEREHQFILEYCKVLKPLTMALDILQGEDNCYYGLLLPTLEVLMARTLAMKDGLTLMTASLPGVIVQAIKTRFSAVLESRDALLAAMTFPKFKLRWLGGAERREAAHALLVAECRDLPGDADLADNAHQVNATQQNASSEGDFFSFQDQEEEEDAMSADSEVLEYMRSGSELEVLNRFPRVKALFMKFNTAMPSSAPMERLFSTHLV